MIWLLPHPLPPLVSKSSFFLGLPMCRRSNLLSGEGGGRSEWGRSQIIRRRDSLFHKSFNTLFIQAYSTVHKRRCNFKAWNSSFCPVFFTSLSWKSSHKIRKITAILYRRHVLLLSFLTRFLCSKAGIRFYFLLLINCYFQYTFFICSEILFYSMLQIIKGTICLSRICFLVKTQT